MKKILLLLLLISISSKAHTWDEPWQKEIIKTAEYFVLAEVIKSDKDIFTFKLVETFSKKTTPKEFIISGCSRLKLTSYSSNHGLHFQFSKGSKYYLLLTKKDEKNYLIPTPSSGFAYLAKDNIVYATYRHSINQAGVKKDLYERTYQEIWNYYHGEKVNYKYINELIKQNIVDAKPGLGDTFFIQHVCLETAFLLDLGLTLGQLKPYLEYEKNFHTRISALRALGKTKSEESKKYLLELISDGKQSNFEKVFAIWALSSMGDKTYIEKLKAIKDKLSDEETFFNLNIMDPRVGTYFPTPKQAVVEIK